MAETNVGVKLTATGSEQVAAAFKKAGAGAKDFSSEASILSSTIKKLVGVAAGLFAFQKIAQFVKETTTAALDQARALDLVSSAITKAGLDFDIAAPKINEFADSMLNLGREDTETYNALRKLLTKTKDVDQAIRLTKLASDLAASGLGDYTSNVDALVKVLIGRGQRALIQFGVAQMENATIAEQVEAIQNRVTMSTERWAETTEGQITRARVQWNQLKQDMGAFGAITLVNLSNSFTKGYNEIGKNTGGFFKYMTGIFNVGLPSLIRVFKAGWWEMIGDMTQGLSWVAKKMELPEMEKFFKGGQETAEEWAAGNIREIVEIEERFENMWIDLTEMTEGGVDQLGVDFDDLADIADNTTDKVKSSFESLAKSIVSGITKQIDKIKDLRDELAGLSEDIDDQLDKSEEKYQDDLKAMARATQEKIDNIEKEIADTEKAKSQGWRTSIAELEAEKEKEKAILARIGSDVIDIETEIKKDELIVLQEAHQKEIDEIKAQGDRKQKELQLQILQAEISKTKGAIEILTPGAIVKMAGAEAGLKAWEISPNQNTYNFDFAGATITDEQDLIKKIIAALNRASELKQFK